LFGGLTGGLFGFRSARIEVYSLSRRTVTQKGVLKMTLTLLPWTKKKAEPSSNGGFLTRFEEFPFQLSRMRAEFDRLLEQLAGQWPSHWEGSGWRWGLDVEDQDDAVVVRAEAPGFEADDFDLQVSENRLVIRAAKKVETKGKEGETEVSEQECYQSVTLPDGIDKDKVEAKYHNGVLTVKLPKTAEGKAKRIAVKGA
jgi:HSP20 family protein